MITLIVLLFSQCLVRIVSSYPCMCVYQLETSVYTSPSTVSAVLGYMQEYDCKPTYPVDSSTNPAFITVQYNNQLGYVKDAPGYISIESCPGSISTGDMVTSSSIKPVQQTTTAPTVSSITTTLSTKLSTPDLATPSRKPTPTTLKPSTQTAVTTQPTTLKIPTTFVPTSILKLTPTTTQVPTTSSIVTSTSTTRSTPLPQKLTTSTSTTTSSTTSPTTPQATTSSLTTQHTSHHSRQCPTGWINVHLHTSTSCYLMLLDQLFTLQEAMDRCSKEQAHLVMIATRLEQQELEHYIHATTSNSSIRTHYNNIIWTAGMYKAGGDQQWLWYNTVNNRNTTLNYVNWDNSTRYINHTNYSGDKCLALQTWQNLTWVEINCNHHRHAAICEITKPLTHTTPSATTAKAAPLTTTLKTTTTERPTTRRTTTQAMVKETCPSGWTQFENSCYYIDLHNLKTRDDAWTFCNNRQGHAVFIESTSEQDFLVQYIKNQPHYHRIASHHDTGIWLGAKFEAQTNHWYWRAGMSTHRVNMVYTNFASNSHHHDYGRNLMMSFNQDFQWVQSPKDNTYYVVCERPSHGNPGTALIG